MFQILALHPDFEGAKNINVLTGGLHLDLYLDMVTGLGYIHVPNFVSIFILKVQRIILI